MHSAKTVRKFLPKREPMQENPPREVEEEKSAFGS